jgi:hypothetical protein
METPLHHKWAIDDLLVRRYFNADTLLGPIRAGDEPWD